MILIAVGLLLLLIPTIIGYTGSLGLESLQKQKVTCDVSIKNALLQDASIESVSCSSTDTLVCNSLGVQSIFDYIPVVGVIKDLTSDEVAVQLLVGGDSDVESFNVRETSTKDAQVTICTSRDNNKGFVKLLQAENGANVVLDSKGVSF